MNMRNALWINILCTVLTFAQQEEICDPIRISFYPNMRSYIQCLRPYSDKLSNHVRQEGHWPDCDELPHLWEQSQSGKRNEIFVDIGANIGSCTLTMLAHGASTVALSPL